MRAAFPGFADISFQQGGPNIFGGFVFDRDPDRVEPALTASNGLLVGLMHLTAVASAPNGGFVAIDEVENALHPHAIRGVLDAIEERATAENIAVLVATHAPVVLDHFQSRPERVLVSVPDSPTAFVPLTDIRDRDYLNDFSLGRMYGDQTFGAQRP
jgi:predicted ATPase